MFIKDQAKTLYNSDGKIRVPFTSFVDFCLRSDTESQIVKGLEIKKQLEEPYHPSKDYYRPARKIIIDSGGKPIQGNVLVDFCKVYPKLQGHIDNYNKIVRSGKYTTTTGQSVSWQYGQIIIPVSTELSLTDGESSYLYKLYFKGLQPKSRNAATIYQIMHEALSISDCTRIGLIDLVTGRVVPKPKLVPNPRTHLALELNAHILELILTGKSF